jgi:hypothetical protein
MSEAILAQQLRVGDEFHLRHKEMARVVAIDHGEGKRSVVVTVQQQLTYAPNDPLIVYRDPPKGEPS